MEYILSVLSHVSEQIDDLCLCAELGKIKKIQVGPEMLLANFTPFLRWK